MPITLPNDLPAFDILSDEGVMVMSPGRAATQDIRPLRIALLNLMPKKIQTENQFARLIGATPLQIDFQLIRMSDHESRNTAADHMQSFYRKFSDVEATGEKFDGLIKHPLDHKAFGCVRHRNLFPASPYLRGFSDDVLVPVSRWTEVRQDQVDAMPALKTLIASDQAGPCLLEDPGHRALYVFNHFEYDSTTLKDEYDRDVAAGKTINVPENYYPDDDPAQPPSNRWRSHAHLLYGNWINEIYQTTEFDLSKIGR